MAATRPLTALDDWQASTVDDRAYRRFRPLPLPTTPAPPPEPLRPRSRSDSPEETHRRRRKPYLSSLQRIWRDHSTQDAAVLTVATLHSKCRRMKRCRQVAAIGCAVWVVTALLVAAVAYRHAYALCAAPAHYQPPSDRFLVEYYVHGRGMGHTSRSVATINRLNEAGVDVRLFTPKTAFWELHAATMEPTPGRTVAIHVDSILPSMGVWATPWAIWRRIVTDCRVAAESERYPDFVISDGDFPGMFRARLANIPSASIAHGQLFNVAQKPRYISENHSLNAAWDREGQKNQAAAWFSRYIIATHFCALETARERASVVAAPLRPEVLSMAAARREFSLEALPEATAIRNLLLSRSSNSPTPRRRRLVICYFRDRNGQAVIERLLQAGFDVLLMVVDASDRTEELYNMSNNNNNNREDEDAPRLIPVHNRRLFLPLMHIADGVASSAGSQLMTECIHSGMPLLAFFKQTDDEQRLNIELSRSCEDTQVYGTSFDALQQQQQQEESIPEIGQFVHAVRASTVSQVYYDFADNNNDHPPHARRQRMTQHAPTIQQQQQHDKNHLHDAADVILDILQHQSSSSSHDRMMMLSHTSSSP